MQIVSFYDLHNIAHCITLHFAFFFGMGNQSDLGDQTDQGDQTVPGDHIIPMLRTQDIWPESQSAVLLSQLVRPSVTLSSAYLCVSEKQLKGSNWVHIMDQWSIMDHFDIMVHKT